MYIETAEGRCANPFNLQPEDVSLSEIAHVLAMIPRFGGHAAWHYSLAQHAVLASLLVPRADGLGALLYDAPALYFGEPSRPLAQLVSYDLSDHEDARHAPHHSVVRVVRERVMRFLDVPHFSSAAVRAARLRALWTERLSLMPGKVAWNIPLADLATRSEVLGCGETWAARIFADETQLARWAPEQACQYFKERAEELRQA